MPHPRAVMVTSSLAAVLFASCLQSASAPSTSPSASSPNASSPSVTIPSPTASAPSSPTATPVPAAKRSPTPVPAERPSDLVVRLEGRGDTGPPIPSAVLTADGRFVTRTDDNQLRERRLTPAGVQRVRDELAATGLFERDQRFPLEVRPDATPPAHGIGALFFKVWRDTRLVEVQTATSQGAEEVYYQPSPARTRLDRLWKQLTQPETWLSGGAWADSTPRAYEAETFALLLSTQVGQANERPTIDELSAAWPFTVGPLDLGQTLPASAGPDLTRCTVLTREDMVAVANAIARATEPDPVFTLPDGTLLTSFAQADHQGRLVVTVRPLPPDRRSCNGEYAQ